MAQSSAVLTCPMAVRSSGQRLVSSKVNEMRTGRWVVRETRPSGEDASSVGWRVVEASCVYLDERLKRRRRKEKGTRVRRRGKRRRNEGEKKKKKKKEERKKEELHTFPLDE